jgi:hypothetical protein
MKNKFFILTFVATCWLGLSCQKKEQVEPNLVSEKQSVRTNSGLSVKNGILAFPSWSMYQELIESLEKNEVEERINLEISSLPDFISLKNYLDNPDIYKDKFNTNFITNHEEEIIEDEFLQSIINPYGLVIIGDFVFRLNIKNNFVSISKYSEKYDHKQLLELVNEQEIGKAQELLNAIENDQSPEKFVLEEGKIISLPCQIDFEEYMEWTKKPISNGRMAWGCRENGFWNNIKSVRWTHTGTGYGAKMKNKYQAAGIYFSVIIKLKSYVGNSPFSTTLKLNSRWKLKPRCRGERSGVIDKYHAGRYKLKERVYSDTRRLNKFSVTGTSGHIAQQYYAWVEDLVRGY